MIEVLGLIVGCGFFPCLLFGVIMLISFLTCDYIEKFVVKAFCSFKNRRRRFRDKSSLQSQVRSSRKSKEGKQDKSGSGSGAGAGSIAGGHGQKKHTEQSSTFTSVELPSAESSSSSLASTNVSTTTPRTTTTREQGNPGQEPGSNIYSRRSAFDDPPPAYHECTARPRSASQTPNPSAPNKDKDNGDSEHN